jgi:hypothetical protein
MLDLLKNRYLQTLLTLDEYLTREGKSLDILFAWAKDPFGDEFLLLDGYRREDLSAVARIWAGMKDVGLTLEDVRKQVGYNTHTHRRTLKSRRPSWQPCPSCEGRMRLFPENENESQWICDNCALGIYNPESAGEVMRHGRRK